MQCNKKNNLDDNHLSIWPILTSFAIFIFLFGIILSVHSNFLYILYIGSAFIIICIYAWINEINIEDNLQNDNFYIKKQEVNQIYSVKSQNQISNVTRNYIQKDQNLIKICNYAHCKFYASSKVNNICKHKYNQNIKQNINQENNFNSLKLAIYFFLITELALVLSIIISNLYVKYFTKITSNDKFLISEELNIWDIPFINTLILLLSSCVLSWGHDNLMKTFQTYKNLSYLQNQLNNIKRQKNFQTSLLLTITLGVIFLILQTLEYYFLNFSIQTNVNSSIFYFITGFHGAHIFIGIIFLLICYFKNLNNAKILKRNDFIFIGIYWHFVDLVWILVFIFFYLLN